MSNTDSEVRAKHLVRLVMVIFSAILTSRKHSKKTPLVSPLTSNLSKKIGEKKTRRIDTIEGKPGKTLCITLFTHSIASFCLFFGVFRTETNFRRLLLLLIYIAVKSRRHRCIES